jgi:hypothetical protein
MHPSIGILIRKSSDERILTESDGAAKARAVRKDAHADLVLWGGYGVDRVPRSEDGVYGDTAVVTSRATSTGYGINSRIIQIWVKQGDTWRVVAGQNTPIGQAKPTSPPAEKKP